MHSLVAPEKPPRVNLTKTANELDAAQLTMSTTMVNTIQTDDNDKNTMKATSAAKNTTSLTRQLSVDKATMTKRKHLHFHSPLVKGPMKMMTMQQHQQQHQQLQQQQQRDEQYPYSLFANIMLDKTRKANAIITTTGIRGIKLTKDVQTMKTSNVPTKAKTINTKAYYQHDHDDNYSNAHHHSYEHHGRVSKAMSLKEIVEVEAAVKATGSTNASTRLDRGCTSLMYACQHGDISEVISQLSNKTAAVHQRDRKWKNALHYCAAASELKACDKQLNTNSLVAAASIAMAAPELLESADEDGFTPLHLAVIQGNLAMVNLLLSNKADVNVVDNEGHSVVHWATVCGEVEALRAVLAAGAAVTTPDINGGTPLHYAAQMCGASYESKISVSNATQLALEILDILLKHPQSSVDVQDKDGRQPLLWAASAGSAKAVIALVKAGARVESADKDGLTALHCAASRGHTECLDTLISLCGAPTDLIDANGCTGLHYAVTLGHADATARLLDLDADPNRQDRKGRTPAHCGCAKGQFETVRLLKERGANLWLRNAKGDLPVHEAASSGRRELVEWLLELRANQVNTTSNDGRSLLHIAAASDYTDMCKMLLDRGAEINALYRSSKGTVMTPLDCSLQKGFRSTAKFLQSQGGLPAGKLRLTPRRANPFADSPVHNVHPLRYNDKEELQDVSESKKYTVYKKRMTTDTKQDVEGDCSCTERTYKREQRFAHTCKRHQRRKKLRRRTSSCGDPKDMLCKQEDSSDICRSKSNIELRRAHAREQYYSTSGSEECEEDLDSCENCCFHKHQKQRVLHRRRARRSKDRDCDEEENQQKKSVKSTESIVPLAIEKGQTPEPAKEPNVTDEEPIVAEQITTTVDVHRTPKELEPVEKTADEEEEIVISTAVDEKIEQVVDKVLEMAAEELQATIETKIEENAEQENNLAANNQLIEEVKEVKVDDEGENNSITNVQIKEIPATPLESVTPVQTENEQDATKKQQEKEEQQPTVNEEPVEKETEENNEPASADVEEDKKPLEREHEARRSFTLLPSDSAEDEEEDAEPETERKSSFHILKSDESAKETEYTVKIDDAEFSDNQVFQIMPEGRNFKNTDHELSSAEGEIAKTNYVEITHDESEQDVLQKRFQANSVQGRHSLPTTLEPLTATGSVTVFYDQGSGRKRRMKRRVRSAGKTRSNWKNSQEIRQYTTPTTAKDQQDSGFEPSPRALKSKIPTPRNIYTAYATRRPIYATLDGRSCSSRFEARKPGDRLACDMSTVTRSIQRNIRRYYMERKIFQHLLDLKSLQIRSNKLNEAVLVKRAVDDYHKSCAVLGGETGTRLRRYTYTEYTFKNFELFLYETLKSLQKPGTYNFQNINQVYEEAERRLSPDYNAYEKALQCTSKTHRCLHAAHAYTGIPCAAYIPMMNHHTMPKFGFGSYQKNPTTTAKGMGTGTNMGTGMGSFYLPKILTKTNSCGGGKVALELSSGKNKQLISLPAEKFDSNKRYYVTFTVKESGNIGNRDCHSAAASQTHLYATMNQDASNINNTTMTTTTTNK